MAQAVRSASHVFVVSSGARVTIEKEKRAKALTPVSASALTGINARKRLVRPRLAFGVHARWRQTHL
jgi:hypothetical protein